jgi:hypothetical protein
MPPLAEFPRQVLDSHALIVAGLLAEERQSPETLVELAAELLSVDKLTVLAARQARTIAEAYACWEAAATCFQACLDLWNRAPLDDVLVAGHRRLLMRLVCSASERREFYHVTAADRATYHAQRV